MKAALRSAWMAARAWQANGMSHFEGPAWLDPPPNQDADVVASPFHPTVLDGPTQAWPWYLATSRKAWPRKSKAGCHGRYAATTRRRFASASGMKMFMRDRDDGGVDWTIPVAT